MNMPKPTPPIKKLSAKSTVSTPTARKAPQADQVKKANFKLKSHLTHRPFSNEALFAKLREQAQPDSMRTTEKGDK